VHLGHAFSSGLWEKLLPATSPRSLDPKFVLAYNCVWAKLDYKPKQIGGEKLITGYPAVENSSSGFTFYKVSYE
jgi:hypothetical protein